ncbi:hypothetical protein DES53_106357 [Roseimicrobium gellanilyticum]|uniref:Uncharacterized protein n=1 Tax=Roseimicrobium gellanilyticum TaxID=748857 RepID=A0A366HIR0_9BACT|nr:hypothetical protein [Roseimicrobium gellanilyticum]RBP42648.1 hypothetical protein DES53_106357 [Roseimicrobium gellanilyticum]
MNTPTPPVYPNPGRSSGRQKVLLVLCVLVGIIGITASAATIWYYYNFKAAPFKPVNLTVAEKDTLNSKLAALESGKLSELEPSKPTPSPAATTTPAPSDPAKTIVLSEREINGWLADQPDWADKVKFHMNNDMLGATFLLPIDPSTKYIGGKTIRIKVAFNTKLDENHKLHFSLANLSVGGIPVRHDISLPNAWLGDAKGVNLFADNGPGSFNSEFLQRFAAGIKDFKVGNGELRMVLND